MVSVSPRTDGNHYSNDEDTSMWKSVQNFAIWKAETNEKSQSLLYKEGGCWQLNPHGEHNVSGSRFSVTDVNNESASH